jgi:tRNA 2-thiouridine synthesizing protein C
LNDITFVFQSSPHIVSAGREGVEAVLAASALCDEITVVFLGDGVAHLLEDQEPALILSKHYAPMLKLFELYEIEHIFVCRDSLVLRGLDQATLVVDAQLLSPKSLRERLRQSQKILTF